MFPKRPAGRRSFRLATAANPADCRPTLLERVETAIARTVLIIRTPVRTAASTRRGAAPATLLRTSRGLISLLARLLGLSPWARLFFYRGCLATHHAEREQRLVVDRAGCLDSKTILEFFNGCSGLCSGPPVRRAWVEAFRSERCLNFPNFVAVEIGYRRHVQLLDGLSIRAL